MFIPLIKLALYAWLITSLPITLAVPLQPQIVTLSKAYQNAPPVHLSSHTNMVLKLKMVSQVASINQSPAAPFTQQMLQLLLAIIVIRDITLTAQVVLALVLRLQLRIVKFMKIRINVKNVLLVTSLIPLRKLVILMQKYQ